MNEIDTTSEDTSPSDYRTRAKKKKGKGWIFGLMMPLTVLAPLWFFFLGPKLRHDHLVEKGIQVPGRLIGVEETGTTVNDSPELELTVELRRKDGKLDTATCDFVPSLRSLHLFQEGVAVTAAYDPEDPKEITVVDLMTGSSAPAVVPGDASASAAADSLRRVSDSLRKALEEMQAKMKAKE